MHLDLAHCLLWGIPRTAIPWPHNALQTHPPCLVLQQGPTVSFCLRKLSRAGEEWQGECSFVPSAFTAPEWALSLFCLFVFPNFILGCLLNGTDTFFEKWRGGGEKKRHKANSLALMWENQTPFIIALDMHKSSPLGLPSRSVLYHSHLLLLRSESCFPPTQIA